MEKKTLTKLMPCNTDRLYGSLDDAVKYLKEIKEKQPNAQLHENWTGYEDMEMTFIYSRLETDEEFAESVKVGKEKKAEEQRRAAQYKKKKELDKEIKALQQKRDRL